MSTYQGILFSISDDKESPETRITRGVMITKQAKQSTLYQAPEIKAPVDGVIQKTVDLKTAVDNYNASRAGLEKSKTALAAAVAEWDGAYDVLIVNAEQKCATPDDGTSLALPVREKTKNPFAMPVSVELRYDAKIDALRIHVNRAPGMLTVCVQISQEPSNPASWHELDGNGARHTVPHPAPGTWFVRAASRTAKGKSDFTSPVSVVVR